MRSRLWLTAMVFGLALAASASGCSDAASTVTTTPAEDAGATTLATLSPGPPAEYVTVDVNEAFARTSEMGSEAVLVDVREPDEWAATGVPVGAVLMPLGELQQRASGELAKDKPVYVICNSGNRSRIGAQMLIDLGYGEVYNVDGGIQAWLAAALPVEYRP